MNPWTWSWAATAVAAALLTGAASHTVDRDTSHLGAAPSRQSSAARPDVAAIETLIQQALDRWRHEHPFPGATAAFILPDGTSGAVATGFASVEDRTPLHADAHMLSGSIGKTYVATILLELVGEGKVKLSDHLSQYLGSASWYAHLPNGRAITLRDLMHHTSGLLDHVYDPRFEVELQRHPGRWWTPTQLVWYDLDQKPLGPAGTIYRYADTNYIHPRDGDRARSRSLVL